MPGQRVPDLCPLCHVSGMLLYYFSGISVKKWHTTFYISSEQVGTSGKAIPLCSFRTAGPMEMWAGDKVCL